MKKQPLFVLLAVAFLTPVDAAPPAGPAPIDSPRPPRQPPGGAHRVYPEAAAPRAPGVFYPGETPTRIWVPDHWERRGDQWVWVRGHFIEHGSQGGSDWRPGHWEKRTPSWIWVPGQWARD